MAASFFLIGYSSSMAQRRYGLLVVYKSSCFKTARRNCTSTIGRYFTILLVKGCFGL